MTRILAVTFATPLSPSFPPSGEREAPGMASPRQLEAAK